MVDITNAVFIVEDGDANTFNYRYFFMVDPSDKNITAKRNNTQTNLVKLRYAVGNSYTRLATDLRGDGRWLCHRGRYRTYGNFRS